MMEEHGDNETLQALLQEASAAVSNNDGSATSRAKIIYFGQALISLLSVGESTRNKYLEPLSRALLEQHETSGEWDALENALELLGEAIEATDEDEDIEAACLGDLYSRCMRCRFMRGRNEQDLETAIKFGEDSVDRTRDLELNDKTELLVDRQNNLSLCYFTKAHQVEGTPPHVLDDAVDLAEDSLRLVDELNNSLKFWLQIASSLGMYLMVRGCRNDNVDDLDRSIELGYKVLARCPQNQPDAHGEALSELAFRLQRGYNHYLRSKDTPQNGHLAKGISLLNEALGLMLRAISVDSERQLSKLDKSLSFVLYIKQFPLELQANILFKTYPLLKDQVELMEQIAIMSKPEDRQDLLSTYYGLPRFAAAAAIGANMDPFEALRLLEIGRGLVLSIQSSYGDNEDLVEVDTLLRDEYVTAREELNQAIDEEAPLHERQRLLSSLQTARFNIRALPGQQNFDKSLSKDAMVDLSSDGPIIVINVTDILCHAIMIQKNGIQVITLPDTNEETFSERSWEIQQLLAKDARDHETSYELHLKLSAFMKDLWKWIASPVLTSLGYDQMPSGQQKWPHVWWVLTGVLSLYPIHAAGVGLHSKKNNVMNRVISSYAPTLKSLGRSRAQYNRLQRGKTSVSSSTRMPDTSISVIAMPETAERVSLEYAEKEGIEITSLFSHAKLMDSPTKAKVVEALTQGPTIIHFSCHGEVDYDFPWKSKILLKDWQEDALTVQNIHDMHLSNNQNSQVAFLSACFTANAGVENRQDEMDHLVTALQLAGFMSVVGTLWDVQQKSAYEVVKEFYRTLATKEGGFDAKYIATALHFAVLKFRESTREVGNDMKGNPMVWAPFVNFGI